MVGKYNNEELIFRNAYSIGISSVNNIKNLNRVKLISMNSHMIQDKNNSKKKSYYFIKVGDVIKYDEVIDINSNDLSPESTLVNLNKDNKSVDLFKEETTKLFEAQIYSDLLGMFDEENPNGIIQTEIKKRFNINTQRHDVEAILKWAFPGVGFAQYFDVFFEFSKIEKNNKFLSPQNDITDLEPITEISPFFTPISLFQYRNFAIGGNLNILTLENPNTKMNFTIDAGYLFGRSGIKDFGESTTVEEINDTETLNFKEKFLNNMEVPIEAKLILVPEKRLNFTVSNRLSWFETFDDNINLSSLGKGVVVSKNRWLNTISAGINLNISSSGRLFVRYKMTHELDNINTNFSRLQFGYSFYLLQNKESKNPQKNFQINYVFVLTLKNARYLYKEFFKFIQIFYNDEK